MEPNPCPIVRVILNVSIDHLAAAPRETVLDPALLEELGSLPVAA
jgi:hypothetical protein